MWLSILTTLTDPVFLARHWELVLALVLLAAGGPIAKLSTRLAALLVRPFARLIGPGLAEATYAATLKLAEIFDRLPGIIARPLTRALEYVERYFGNWINNMLRLLGYLVSKGFDVLPRIIQRAFKIAGIILFIGAIKDAIGFVGYLIDKVKELIGRRPSHPDPSLGSIPGAGIVKGAAGLAGNVVGAIPRATGGLVPWNAGVRGVDSVPALLTPGEMILNRQQQKEALGGQRFLAGVFGFTGAEGPGVRHRRRRRRGLGNIRRRSGRRRTRRRRCGSATRGHAPARRRSTTGSTRSTARGANPPPRVQLRPDRLTVPARRQRPRPHRHGHRPQDGADERGRAGRHGGGRSRGGGDRPADRAEAGDPGEGREAARRGSSR